MRGLGIRKNLDSVGRRSLLDASLVAIWSREEVQPAGANQRVKWIAKCRVADALSGRDFSDRRLCLGIGDLVRAESSKLAAECQC